MKNQHIINLLFVFILTVIVSCGGSTESQQKSVKSGADEMSMELNLQSIELGVEGMTCEGCENAVIGAIIKLDGVKTADASHLNKIASVTYDTTLVTIDQIRMAVEKSGYTAGDFEVLQPEN